MDGGNGQQQLAIEAVSTEPMSPVAKTRARKDWDRVRKWFLRTDHVLGRQLDDLRVKFGIDPTFTVLVTVAAIVLSMMQYREWAPTISQVCSCCTYPIFESFNALSYRDQDGLRIWCVYWAVYNFMGSFDPLSSLTVLYYPLKTFVAVYLFLPPIQYVRVIHDAWLMPVLQLIYGELHIDALRWAHPRIVQAIGLTPQKVREWSQEQFQDYLANCRRLFYLALVWVQQVVGEQYPSNESKAISSSDTVMDVNTQILDVSHTSVLARPHPPPLLIPFIDGDGGLEWKAALSGDVDERDHDFIPLDWKQTATEE